MRRIALMLLFVIVLILTGFSGLAAWQIHQLTRATNGGSDESIALELAQRVVARFNLQAPFSRYYGAFYSSALPGWARLPVGSLEAIAQPSDCDSMVRGLIFALAQQGIPARQADFFAPLITHTVVEATIGGRPALLDPYLNVVFRSPDGRLASPLEAVSPAFSATALPLLAGGPPMRKNVYRDRLQPNDTAVLYEGEPGLIPVWIDAGLVRHAHAQGVADTVINAGDEWDKTATGVGITFLGPRYGRRRDKLLKAMHLQPDERLTVTFFLRSTAPPALASDPGGACRSEVRRVTCNLPLPGPDGRAQLRIADGQLPTVFWVMQTTARLAR
jgi:hypothetical protein